jgi:predicted small lipoprotein YifL
VILIVKSLFDLSRFVALAFVAVLAGCGQKGPLYLPAKPAPVATPAPQTAPAPDDTKSPAYK